MQHGENILQFIWDFKKKRYSNGSLKKYKARFYGHGDQQIDSVSVFKTYALVVSWITVHLLLVVSLVLDLQTQHVNYKKIFFQALLEQSVYIQLPRGFENPNQVNHFMKSVYGLRQSPLNFYQHLQEGLEDRKFKKSDQDDRLFTNGTVVVLFWVDNCTFYSKESKDIDDMVSNLKDGFLLEREEDVAEFLEIKINRDKYNVTISLTKTGLIDKILDDTWMEDSNHKYTREEKDPLHKDT